MSEENHASLELGMVKKFIVSRVDGMEDEGNYFVLAPERDRAAYEAIKVYRDQCSDPALKKDLSIWISDINRKMGWDEI